MCWASGEERSYIEYVCMTFIQKYLYDIHIWHTNIAAESQTSEAVADQQYNQLSALMGNQHSQTIWMDEIFTISYGSMDDTRDNVNFISHFVGYTGYTA